MGLNKYLLIVIGVLVAIVLIVPANFLYKHSYLKIRRDFSKAFTYRMVGDCEKFVQFVNTNRFDIPGDKWRERCEDEKSGDNPISDFSISSISHEFFSDKAFIQIRLERSYRNEDNFKFNKYAVDYQLIFIDGIWKINNQI